MDRNNALELALAQIERQFGKGSVMRLGEQSQGYEIDVIHTGSIVLDNALGVGGVPRGRVVEIFGPESSGKTTVGLHIIAEAQRLGGNAAFIDAEHALDPLYAKNLGVNVDELLISQPDTGEQALEIVEALVRSGAIDVIVVDSVAALVPRAEIEGEMGDSHVGLQARLMSQALRKLTGVISKSNTCAIFINQIREKVGVMFGCLDYDTPVVQADGRRRSIGRLVHRQEAPPVLTFDRQSGEVREGKIVGWYRNGAAPAFLELQVAAAKADPHRLRLTPNHPVLTPDGFRQAGELAVGDLVMTVEEGGGEAVWSVARGWLIAGGRVYRRGAGVQVRSPRLDPALLSWEKRLAPGLSRARAHLETPALPSTLLESEVSDLGRRAYHQAFFDHLDALALAVWTIEGGHMEHDHLVLPAQLTPDGLSALATTLSQRFQIDCEMRISGLRSEVLVGRPALAKLLALVASFMPPEPGEAKQPPAQTGGWQVVPRAVVAIGQAKALRSRQRFDIQVEGSHTFVADGVIVHNSPETTPGGRALKFYASVRLDVRRIEAIKLGTEMVGNRTRVRVVKNKVAPPFRVADFDILYGHGISREGSLIDLGTETKVLQKSGSWFSYGDLRIGQGRESTREYLKSHPELADEIDAKIRESLLQAPVHVIGPSPQDGPEEEV